MWATLRFPLLVSCAATLAAAIIFSVLFDTVADADSRRAVLVAGAALAVPFMALLLLIGRAGRATHHHLRDNLRLRAAIAGAPAGFVLLDAQRPDAPVTFVNPTFERMTGYSSGEVIGRGLDLVYGSAMAGVVAAGAGTFDLRGRRKDGSVLWAELNISAILDDDGRQCCWVVVQNDVGRRHAVEEALATSERRLRLITDSVPALIGYVDRDLRYRFVNRCFEDWFGRPTEWYVGRSVELLAGKAFERARPAIMEALAGRVTTHQDQVRLANGGTRDLRIDFKPHISEGEVEGFFVLAYDVTQQKQTEQELRCAHEEMHAAVELRTRELRREIQERRQMEAALRESERRFRDVAESASDWFWEMGPDLRFTYFSERITDFTGVSPEVYLGRNRREAALPEDIPILEAHFADMEARRPFRDVSYRMKRPDGSYRHIRVSGKPVFDEDGRFLGYRGIGSDITDQVAMEAQTAALQQQLAIAVDSMPNGFILWDHQDRLVLCNDALRRFFPEASDSFEPGLHFQDYLTLTYDGEWGPDGLTEWMRNRIHMHQNPGERTERQRADGRWLMVVEHRTPTGHIVGIYTDITDRKHREEALEESEQRFRQLVQTAGSAILVIAPDLRLVEINKAGERIYGLDRAQMVGRSYLDLCASESARQMAIRDIGHVLTGEAMAGLESHVLGADGVERDVIWNANRLVGSDGNVTGLIAVGQDISERKRAERALRDSQAALRDLHRITASQDMDFHEKLRALLELGCRRFGLGMGLLVRFGDPAEVVESFGAGIGVAGLLADHHWTRALASAEPIGFVRNGEPGILESLLAARVVVGDQVFGSLGFVGAEPRAAEFSETDLEVVKLMAQWVGGEMARIQVEYDLRLAKDQAELANRTKTEFLANMGHELRTPLNAIIGFSEVMIAQVFGPVGAMHYAGYVKNINDSGRHLLEVINDILDVSKIEAGRLDLIEEELPVTRIVESTIRLVRERATAAGLTLEVRPVPDLPSLRADQRRVKQVLLNLLSNAIKFTPVGGRITVSAELTGEGALAFAVEDTGVGMAPEDIPKAMAAFGQIDSRLSRRYDGTGLGLPLTRSLMELHGGTLLLDSAPGRGTKVTAIFPRTRVIELRDSVTATAD